MIREPLTFGSLFAGVGGFDLGLERAGMVCRWQVELDPFAQKILAKHWPNVARYGDIKECGEHNLEPVDLICGGFPCQDISYAGKGAGLAGDRSGLWFEYARIIREMEPRYVLVENVAALLNRGMGDVLGTLADCGYDAQWSCIRGCDMGAPHQRDRIFIVAYPRSERGPRLEQATGAVPDGPWGWRGEADLRDITEEPYRDDPRWPQPLLRRVDDGLSGRVDRLRAIGNAVMPQIPEWIGKQIVDYESRRKAEGA